MLQLSLRALYSHMHMQLEVETLTLALAMRHALYGTMLSLRPSSRDHAAQGGEEAGTKEFTHSLTLTH